MLEHSLEEKGDFCECFIVNQEIGGIVEPIDLIENGNSILVTDSNKEEFVKLCIKYYTETMIENFL